MFTTAPWKMGRGHQGPDGPLWGLLGEKNIRNVVMVFKPQNGTAGHPDPKINQAIRYHGSK